ncbi:MAG: YbbR-like domain-containing protein [Bacteroidales bacterium]
MFNRRHIFTNSNFLYKEVKNLLSKAQSKELLTFLFFLCLSFLFWILQSMNEVGEATYTIPVEYRSVPVDVVFSQTPPDQIQIRVRDKGIILLNYSFNHQFTPVIIDFDKYQKSKGEVKVQGEQIALLLKKQLNPTTTLVALQPDALVLLYSKHGVKKVPVEFRGELTSAPQALIGRNIQLTPDSVELYAPESVLDTIKSVSTELLVLSNLSDTVTKDISIRQSYGTKADPAQVRVTIPVEEYTEKKLQLPIEVSGLPDSLMMRTFPSVINLSCFVTLSSFREVSPDMFELGVNYNEVKENTGNKVSVEVIRVPDFVTNVRIQPDSVEFILEEKDRND